MASFKTTRLSDVDFTKVCKISRMALLSLSNMVQSCGKSSENSQFLLSSSVILLFNSKAKSLILNGFLMCPSKPSEIAYFSEYSSRAVIRMTRLLLSTFLIIFRTSLPENVPISRSVITRSYLSSSVRYLLNSIYERQMSDLCPIFVSIALTTESRLLSSSISSILSSFLAVIS